MRDIVALTNMDALADSDDGDTLHETSPGRRNCEEHNLPNDCLVKAATVGLDPARSLVVQANQRIECLPAHSPVYSGGRFSLKAVIPSRPSLLRALPAIVLASNSIWVSSADEAEAWRRRFTAP